MFSAVENQNIVNWSPYTIELVYIFFISEETSHDQVSINSTIKKYWALIEIICLKLSFYCPLSGAGLKGRDGVGGSGGVRARAVERGWGKGGAMGRGKVGAMG